MRVERRIKEKGMDWYWWAGIVVGVLGVVALRSELPAIRRYLKMKSM